MCCSKSWVYIINHNIQKILQILKKGFLRICKIFCKLWFIIYTHDLLQHIFPPVDCKMFADDTALCTVTDSLVKLVQSLQVSTTTVGKWLCDWRLTVNLSKTTVMFTSHNLPTNYSDTAPIYLYGEPLPSASQQRHLGIIISADLCWSHHISHILNKARCLPGVLKRLRSSLSQQGSLLKIFY